MTESDESAAQLLLVWRIGRLMYASSNTVGDGDISAGLPGFSAFCGMLYEQKHASNIAYLPLIPKLLADHMVLQEEMIRLVKTSNFIGKNGLLYVEIRQLMNLLQFLERKIKSKSVMLSYFWVGSMKHIITSKQS